MILKPDNHEEWLKLRLKGIGGSDAGTVIGKNKIKKRPKKLGRKNKKTDVFMKNTYTAIIADSGGKVNGLKKIF